MLIACGPLVSDIQPIINLWSPHPFLPRLTHNQKPTTNTIPHHPPPLSAPPAPQSTSNSNTAHPQPPPPPTTTIPGISRQPTPTLPPIQPPPRPFHSTCNLIRLSHLPSDVSPTPNYLNNTLNIIPPPSLHPHVTNSS